MYSEPHIPGSRQVIIPCVLKTTERADEMKSKKLAKKSHILIVDDDRRIRELIVRFLGEHGYIALSAGNAAQAWQVMENFEIDALILDIMMPGQTGLDFVSELRSKENNIPVLLLTALGEVEDRIAGFEIGADDYLPKPFEPKEMILRLESILRRTSTTTQNTKKGCQIGQWFFDPRYDELVDTTQEGHDVRLTSVEANLLRALAESADYPVSREDLAQRCGLDAGERTIDVQVTRLRRKIESDTKQPKFLQTVRGKGYMLRSGFI